MPTTRRTLLTGAVALALSPAPGRAANPDTIVHSRRLSFTSDGREISAEIFPAPSGGAAPAVIMLHGADGLSVNAMYRSGARTIAGAGFNVYLVHYLDRTGERRASFASLFQNFPLWTEVVRDAISYVARRPETDPDRIAIVGISLGAALGLAVAAEDRRIRALVDYFGPLPHGALTRTARLPPLLVLHGAADPIVPVENAHAVEALAREQGTPCEVVIYPGQGHGFRGNAEGDATQRVLAFLKRHLDPQRAANHPATAG
jgi:dienelactone hydrolase